MNASEYTVRARIWRTPRGREEAPKTAGGSFEEYTVTVGGDETVLEVLERIQQEQQHDLVFRRACRHGSCGTCACKIDGKESLACISRIAVPEDGAPAALRVEPLSGARVTADLAVDRDAFFSKLPAGAPSQRVSELHADSRKPLDLPAYTRFENCIDCGACLSVCPVGPPFVGPAALAAAARLAVDNPARVEEVAAFAGEAGGVDSCIQSFECSRVCPTEVYPSRKIIDLRNMLAARSS